MLKAFLIAVVILALLLFLAIKKAIRIFDKWGEEAEEDLPWD